MDQFVAVQGNGSTVKELQAINLWKGGTRGMRKIEKEGGGQVREDVVTEIERQKKEDGLSSISNYWKTTVASPSFMCYTSLSLVPGHVGMCFVSKSIYNILGKSYENTYHTLLWTWQLGKRLCPQSVSVFFSVIIMFWWLDFQMRLLLFFSLEPQ